MSPLLVGATAVDNEQHAPESLDGSAGSLRLLPHPVSLRILASPTRSSEPRQGKKKKNHEDSNKRDDAAGEQLWGP